MRGICLKVTPLESFQKKKKKKEMGDKAALHTQTQKQLQPHGRAQQVGGGTEMVQIPKTEKIYIVLHAVQELRKLLPKESCQTRLNISLALIFSLLFL